MRIHIRRTAIVKNLIIILVLAYSIMPIVSRFISSVFSTYFYMIILLFLAVLIVFSNKKVSLNRNVWILYPFIVWRCMELFVTGESLIMWGYQSLIMLIPIILGTYILKYLQHEHRFFCSIICLAFGVTIITTIIGLLQYPEAARWLATVESSENARLIMYNWKNMGGYDFVYSVVLLYPLVIFAHKQKKIKAVWAFCLTVGILLMLILAQYTTALLLFLVSSILFVVKRDLKKNDLILLIIVEIIFCIVLSDAVSEVLMWLGDMLNSDIFSQRLYALAGGKTGLQNAETKRLDLYLKSINTFLNHPLLGTFLRGGYGSSGHSFVLDILARFGLLGAVVLFSMYKKIYELFYAPFRRKKGYGFILWIFLQTILLSCLNTGMWLYVLTLYVPLLVYGIYGER